MTRVATLAMLLLASNVGSTADRLVIGSKTFTESYLLAEIMAQQLEASGFEVVRQFGFGGTLVCYEALVNGEIDAYPEYTGTISQTILKLGDEPDAAAVDAALAGLGLQTLSPLGFNNTYAIAVSDETAARHNLRSISDLGALANLRFGFSHEFRNREDGWPGMARAYHLDRPTSGIEHGLAYRAIADGHIDVTDAYATDGDIERYNLVILDDDRKFFPRYDALPLTRRAMPTAAVGALEKLAGRISEAQMRRLNAEVVVNDKPIAEVAQAFLAQQGLVAAGLTRADSAGARLWRNTIRHLQLTGIALLLACLIGLPAGMLVHRSETATRVVLYIAGLLQTIPSIALLALMIPLFGVGVVPAVIALFLYSLLPILRNTTTALNTIDPVLRRVAAGMGLDSRQQMRHVILPLASPNVLAGIRTAAIISIGTATLAAFIGAGGLGEPIVTGLALNDTNLILQGAVPAAVLALLVELAFELLERRLIPAHLRRNNWAN